MVHYPKWLIAQFRPHLGKCVVEVGAGRGNVTSLLLKCGAERIVAIEPDELMFDQLSAKFAETPGVRPVRGYASEVLPTLPEPPDSIVYVNVLEHVEDDAGEIALCISTLKKGGRLCVFVPAMRFLYSPYDHAMGHYRRYGKAELRALCRKTGLKVMELKYFDFPGAFAWFLHFRVMGRMGQETAFVGLYDRLVIPLTRTLESIVPPPFGKNLVLIAEKP